MKLSRKQLKWPYGVLFSMIFAINVFYTSIPEESASAASLKSELNYVESAMYPEKVVTWRLSADETENHSYLTLRPDLTLTASASENEAAYFELYTFDDGTSAFKSLDNDKFLSFKGYNPEDEKVIKADAESIGWNERFALQETEEGMYITSHFTFNRDEWNRSDKHRNVSLAVHDGKPGTLSLNVESPSDETSLFELTEAHLLDLSPDVYPTVRGTEVVLQWKAVDGYSDPENYAVKDEGGRHLEASIHFNDGQLTAVLDQLTVGKEHQLTVLVNKNGQAVGSTVVPVRIFEHPGIMHSTEELDALRYHVSNKMEPWYSDWIKLKNSVSGDLSSLNFVPRPSEGVGRGNPADSGNMGNFEKSGQAAYLHALQWVANGDNRHADKVVEILNAWAYELKVIDGRDNILGAGLNAYKFANAAEIIRYYDGGYEGYEEADFNQLQDMMIDVVYPVIQDAGTPMIANGNWDTAAYLSMISIGVLTDNTDIFNRALAFYQSPDINGSIKNYLIDTGQNQESGRDQAHSQLGVGTMAMTAEVAWQQGIDLYSLENNRLYKGFEYLAKYNLFHDVPFEPVPNVYGRTDQWSYWPDRLDQQLYVRGELRSIYEIGLRHYQNRMGLEAKWTEKAAEAMRAEGFVHLDELGFGTLTKYAGKPTEQPRPQFKLRTREGSKYERNLIQLPDGTYTAETKKSYFALQTDGTLATTAQYADAPYFELHTFEDGTYAIKSLANNKYLSVKSDQQYVIKADAETVGQNERFKFFGNGNGLNYLTFPGLGNRRVSTVDTDGTSSVATLSLSAETPKKDTDMFVFMYNEAPTETFLTGALAYVESLEMKQGIKKSLTIKINQALDLLRHNEQAALFMMNAVTNQMNAQAGKAVSRDQSEELNLLMNRAMERLRSTK